MSGRFTNWFFNTGPLKVFLGIWIMAIMTFVVVHYVLFPEKLNAATLAVPIAVIGIFATALPYVFRRKQNKKNDS